MSRRILLAETIADMLIAEPTLSRKQVAERLSISAHSVGVVVRSDSFRDLLLERKADLIAAATGSTLERAAAVAEAALEKLDLMVEKSQDPEFVFRVATALVDRTAPAVGGGTSSGLHVQFNMVDREVLAQARQAQLAPPPRVLPAPAPPVDLRGVFSSVGD